MNIENIKIFVYKHSERVLSPKQMRIFPLCILCSLFLGSMFSEFFGNRIYAWIMWILFFPYMIWFIAKNRWGKKRYADQLLLLGSFSLMLSIFFLILSFIFVDLLGRNVVAYKCGIILSLFLASLIYCVVRLITIKNMPPKKHIDAQKRAPSIAIYAGISVFGIAFARTVLGELSQDLVIKICIFLSSGMAILFLLGIDPLLKYYFCRKYKIDIE